MLLDWLYGAMNHLLGSFDEYLRLERNRSEDTRKRYRTVAQSLLQFPLLPTMTGSGSRTPRMRMFEPF